MGKKAQVATEYIIITGVILIAVTLVFGYSYTQYNMNVNILSANSLLDAIVNTSNLLYTTGQGNILTGKIEIPPAVTDINAMHRCRNGDVVSGNCTDLGQNGLKGSIITIKLDLAVGETSLVGATRYPIEFLADDDGRQFPCTTGSEFCSGVYTVLFCMDSEDKRFCPACPDDRICVKKI